MKLLTQELAAKIPPLYSQEEVKDPIVVAKWFVPWNQWTWLAYEGSWERDDSVGGQYPLSQKPEGVHCRPLMFGLVVGFEKELGYFDLDELAAIRGPMGLTIERDLYFEPKPLSQIRKEYGG